MADLLHDESRLLAELSAEQDAFGSPARVNAAVRRVLASGRIRSGARLPTLARFAEHTGISRSSAVRLWNGLRDDGLIATNKRGGSRVVAPGQPRGDVDHSDGLWQGVDLGRANADTSLLPDLAEAMTASLTSSRLNQGGRDPITPRLRQALAATTPVGSGALLAVGGQAEAVFLSLSTLAKPGARVGIVQPVNPGILGIVRNLGLDPVPIDMDESGPALESLRAALAQEVSAIVLDPGATFADRGALTVDRAAEIAELISGAGDVLLIENDALGALSESPSVYARMDGGRAVRIRNHCLSYGIDLRTSVVAGPEDLVEAIGRLRSGGSTANSRILQDALAHLIDDDDVTVQVRDAWAHYVERRRLLADALAAHEVTYRHGAKSLVVWVEVGDETAALVALTSRGFTVGSGSQSFVRTGSSPLLRLSVTQLPEDPRALDVLARHVAEAAAGAIGELTF